MDTYQAILKRRSIRRFKQKPISYRSLIKLVDAARLAPSAANLQPIEYIIVDDKKVVDKIFPYLRWASYLGDKGAPEENRRPSAYIVVSINKEKCQFPQYAQADLGAAIENILLCAVEFGLGSCWLGAINKEEIAKILFVPENLSVEYVIALGYPDEKSRIEEFKENHKYYKDKNNVMRIPKRSIRQILHRNKFRN